MVGEVVTFTAVASGSAPVTFDWLFGDGEVGTGAVLAHSYAAGGTYTVILTADNCAGVPLSIEYATQGTGHMSFSSALQYGLELAERNPLT